jgi:hypothetical protein
LNKLSKTHQSNQRTKSSKGYEVKPYYSCGKKNIKRVFFLICFYVVRVILQQNPLFIYDI